MRLTLRTLLAYLDDTLEPAQAKIIGQKVAESEQARELMDHIKQVTRRRRLTTPPAGGPGKIDPNTIAEYLDGAVSAEQAGEVEQVCLASDVHLAEMAACHQILALVLGEPALVPPTAKSRMYGLVKGPESIPFRKPTKPQADSQQEPSYVGEDVDETLRMGLPFLGGRGKWANLIMLIGAGLGASALLFFSIWHVLNLPGGEENDNPNGTPVVQGTQNPPEKDPNPKVLPGPKKEPPNGTKKPPKEIKKEPPTELKKDPTPDPVKVKQKEDDNWPPPPNFDPPSVPVKGTEGDVMPENRFTTADNRRLHLGKYLMPSAKDGPSIVAWRLPDKNVWTRLWGSKDEVESGCTYAALPGFRGDIKLDRGLQLTLVGNLPEIMPELPTLESVVDLHIHDSRIDLTLQRGRIVLTSLKELPVAVRVRFANPHTPQQPEFADLLLNKGAQVYVDQIGVGFPPGSHFVKDPESSLRTVPDFFVAFCVVKGSATIRLGSVENAMKSPPGLAMLKWNSVKGSKAEAEKLDALPPFMTLTPAPLEIPDKNQKKFNEDVLKARDDLSQSMGVKSFDVGLAENKDPVTQKDPARRGLVVRSYAALGLLDELIDILNDERIPDAYFVAVPGLQNWVRSGRDHEYLLYERLKVRYKGLDSDKIMELLRGAVANADLLIDYLDNDNIIIRQVSYLSFLGIPGGPSIQYDPTMPTERRMMAQEQFRKLLKKLKEDASKKK